MINLNTLQFKEKIFNFEKEETFKGSRPAVIDFAAEWCGPCKVLGKTLDEVSKEYPDIDFYKVNIDESFELSQYFKIRSIPQVLFISAKDRFSITGNRSKTEIINNINKII